jgi:Uma2 family endonuclease
LIGTTRAIRKRTGPAPIWCSKLSVLTIRERELTVKRHDYAEARIPEYWIVNPLDETVTVLTLDGEQYVEHGIFPRGTQATSPLLEGFTVPVSTVFDVIR